MTLGWATGCVCGAMVPAGVEVVLIDQPDGRRRWGHVTCGSPESPAELPPPTDMTERPRVASVALSARSGAVSTDPTTDDTRRAA